MLILNFSGRFLMIASLRQRRISKYIYFPPAAIPVNYTSKFQEILKILRIILKCVITIFSVNNIFVYKTYYYLRPHLFVRMDRYI